MNEIQNEIAACGLVCAACRRYSSGKCPGCRDYEKAVWCKVRKCCLEHGWQSCADCTTTTSDKCKVFNNFYAKLFSFIFRSPFHSFVYSREQRTK